VGRSSATSLAAASGPESALDLLRSCRLSMGTTARCTLLGELERDVARRLPGFEVLGTERLLGLDIVLRRAIGRLVIRDE